MILDCAALYERFLNDDPDLVPPQKAKNRNQKYIKNTLKYLEDFLTCLSDNGYRLSHTHISAVDDRAVTHFHNYLEERYEKQEIGETTWNRYITTCRIWFKTLNSLGYDLKNPFYGITAKLEDTDPQFLEMTEFEKLLKSINHENGWTTRGVKKIERLNYYRDWLKNYLLLSVFVGARTEEIANLRWSNVQDNYIAFLNQKVNRGGKTKKVVREYIYIHSQLAQLLASMDQTDPEDYILVPEWENRKQLQTFVSKAFSHFIKVAGIDKEVTLYNLRHTFINTVYAVVGEKFLGTLNKKETAIKHYLSKKKKIESPTGNVFSLDIESYI